MAILGGEFDEYAPPELLKQFEEVLSTKHEVSMSQFQKLEVLCGSATNTILM